MIGLLRLASIKYSQKLTTITARLMHLIDKHVRPSFTAAEEHAVALSHNVLVAQEELYGDLSMFLSGCEMQLLGRGGGQVETVNVNDIARGSGNLRFDTLGTSPLFVL